MHFLVVDFRYGTPIYVFMESDPHKDAEFPGLEVREISLEAAPPAPCSRRSAIGRDPNSLDQFREFGSDGAVARAGFILIEPRFVGANWEGYCRHFRPEGEKPFGRAGRPASVARSG
jgi:hypothetical protein